MERLILLLQIEAMKSGNCKICGVWRQHLDTDHIIPKFQGGTDEPSNIQFICQNCHTDKSIKEQQERVFTAEHRAEISARGKAYWKTHDPPMLGKTHTEERELYT